MRLAAVCSIVSVVCLGLPLAGVARVRGLCADCHTMHNSQDGAPMAYVISKTGAKTMVTAVNAALLTTDCVGCHQGTNSGGGVPYVLDTQGPSYGTTGTEGNTLAGGNFYWVSLGQDRVGHNIADITLADQKHGFVPPGGESLGAQITCAGTYGCHGSAAEANPTVAILGSHHGNNMSAYKDGTSIADSYRFLDGVKGLEDQDYEYQPTDTAHNKYYGEDRNFETEEAVGSISNHCARCHGDFHNGSGKMASGSFLDGVWLRHPVDFDMSRAASGTEYEAYNGGGGSNNTYSVITPVASSDTSTTVNSTVNISTDSNNAIVMCLSCHRAHGTPYDAILRWDYKKWPAAGHNGCAVCHTAKD
ncbi:cytochrome c3 family protein [Thiovibrio sp. JS02]